MSAKRMKFSENLLLGGDEWHEFTCSPCAGADRNVAAIKYCVECDENLCSTCLRDHNKFSIMRVHQITDNLSSRTGQRQNLPTQRCDRHGGKLIDVYCTTHDVVGCSTCFNIEHRSCESVRYIPDMTQSMNQSKEISDLETKMTQLLARLNHLKQQKQDNLKLLQQEKDKLLKEIKVLRKNVNDKLDKMERVLVHDVETKLGMRACDVSKDLDIINSELASLEERKKSLKSAKSGDKTELFVQLKTCQSLIQEHERKFESVSRGFHEVNIQVFPNNNIKKMLQNDGASLGSISEILKFATHKPDASIRLASDKTICNCLDICLTSNGITYLVDNGNSRIKKLDESYTVTEHIDLPGTPYGLCEADNKRLAVTLFIAKQVQLLSQNPMKLEESFSVGDCCRGIDCHNGQLYVCCGGRRNNGEGPGRIKVFSIGGDLLRVHAVRFPKFIHVSDNGDLLISNNYRKSIVTLRMRDHTVSKLQIKALRQPGRMFRFSDNLLCVAGFRSNNIVLISEDGEYQQELLTEKDGISHPIAVCFDRQRSCMIIWSGYDKIQLFNLSILPNI